MASSVRWAAWQVRRLSGPRPAQGTDTLSAYISLGQPVNLISAIGLGGAYFGSAYVPRSAATPDLTPRRSQLIKRGEPIGYDTAFGTALRSSSIASHVPAVTSVCATGWSLYWFRKYGRYRQGAQAVLFFLPASYYGYLSALQHRGLLKIAPKETSEPKKYF